MMKYSVRTQYNLTIVFSILLFVSFFITGCGKSLVVNNETLEGIWIVQQATRDKKPTTTLTNGYFKFDSESRISTNILGFGEPVAYTLNKNKISFENTADAQLKVMELDENIMVVESKIKGKEFHFELMKVDSLSIDE